MLKKNLSLAKKSYAKIIFPLLTYLLFPFGVSEEDNGDGSLVKTIFLVLFEAKGVQSGIGGSHLLRVVHSGHSQHTLSSRGLTVNIIHTGRRSTHPNVTNVKS